jgi:hypothetical protein
MPIATLSGEEGISSLSILATGSRVCRYFSGFMSEFQKVADCSVNISNIKQLS